MTTTIYKFPSEEKMYEFDNMVGKFTGMINDSLWIYNEGVYGKWFGLQYCGDRWQFQFIGQYADLLNRPVYKFYPKTFEELVSFVLEKIN